MKKILCLVAMGSLLAACGGGGGGGGSKFKDPNKVQFTYGTPADAASTPYAPVASGGLGVVGSVLSSPPDTASEMMVEGFASAALPLLVNNTLWKGIDLKVFTSSPVLQVPELGILSGAAVRDLALDPTKDPALRANVSCSVAFDDTGLTISNCAADYRYSEDKIVQQAAGNIGGQFAIAADALTWNFGLGVTLSDTKDTVTDGAGLNAELLGQLAVDTTGNTVKGYARASYGVSLSVKDTANPTPPVDGTYDAAVTDQGTWDLTISTADKCVTGGTVTFVRVWTTLPVVTGAATLPTGVEYKDQAVQITYDAPVAPSKCSASAKYALGAVTP